MVSLGRASGQFLEPESSNQDVELLSEIGLASYEEENTFQPISTIWTLVIQLLFLIAFVVILYVPCRFFEPSAVSYTAILAYCHAAVWLISLILESCLFCQRRLHRSKGYLEFYRKTKSLSRLPTFILALGNLFFLILVTLPNNGQPFPMRLTILFMRIVGTIEALLAGLFTFTHLVKTVRFNKARAMPDVERDESTVPLNGQASHSNVGFRDENRTDDLIDKQADLISYLKQHNVTLGKKIVQLTTQLERLQTR